MSDETLLIIRIACPAKINLGLAIIGKRADGYHELETLFQAVDWEDELEISAVSGGGAETLEVVGPFAEGVPSDSRNLVFWTLEKLRLRHQVPALQLRLTKNIPHGSGLGGGSSDVAGLLVGVNRLFSLNVDLEELEAVAASVGSDTAFFVRGGTQWGRGRGEILQPAPITREGAFLLAVPDAVVSTREAYASLSAEDFFPGLQRAEIEAWLKGEKDPAPRFRNSFQEPVAARLPEVTATLAWLEGEGAEQVFLSGSGSTCVGLFGSLEEAAKVANRSPGELKTCRVCRSLSWGVRPF